MKKIILDFKTGVLLCCLFFVTTLSVHAQAVSLNVVATNALSVSPLSVSGNVYKFDVVIPYNASDLDGIFMLTYNNGSFVCIGTGTARYLTLYKSNGAFVTDSANSTYVNFVGTLPVGANDYVFRAYCTRPQLPATLRAEFNIRINVIKEAAPNVNLSFAPFCKLIPDTQQNSGYIGFNVTGNYANADNLYLRVSNPAAACPSADYKVTSLHSSGAATATINPTASIYECDALTTYTIKLVYKATSVSGMYFEHVINSGDLGWNDYSWQKTIHHCLKIVGFKSQQSDLGLGDSVVNEIVADKLRIYPNPTNNDLNILPADGKEIRSVKVVDPNGLVYESKAFSSAKGEQTISLAHLRPGIYFLEIETNEGVAVEKVIKN